MNLTVNEIFYSLQGEGGRQGEASLFIRLTDCNLHCDFCDTDFSQGVPMKVGQIVSQLKQYPAQWIVWTGGEPTLQLTEDILLFFKQEGYLQAIESNGLKPLSGLLDYTVVSPKGNTGYAKRINPEVDEVRLPVQKGDILPSIASLPAALYYFVSPVFTGDPAVTKANIDYGIEQVKEHPEWRLSLQIHQLIGMK